VNPFEHLKKSKVKAEQELNELIGSSDAEALLACMISQLMFTAGDSGFGDKMGNHPGMLESLAILCIPKFGNNTGEPVSALVTNRCYGLLETILRGRMMEDLNVKRLDSPMSDTAAHLAMYNKVVRGFAFPEQTAKKIKNIQGVFDTWFEKKVGVAPSRVIDVFYTLIAHAEILATECMQPSRELGEEWKQQYTELLGKDKRENNEQNFVDLFLESGEDGAFYCGFSTYQNRVMPKLLPSDLSELELMPPLSSQEIAAFKELFSVSKNSVCQVEYIQRKPFYELTSGKLLFSEISNGFDVVWDKFEEIARTDGRFYDKQYQRKKSKWLEARAYEHLSKIFPKDNIYQNLTYPDPTKVNGTTELDLAVKWGPFLIVLEAKAKQFRFESITGDEAKLRTDIKKNISDSYEQSLRAIKYIEGNKTCRFVEANTQRELLFDSEDIYKIFPISLSFHHLAGIATQLNDLKDLNLFMEGRYPFSICESDLELIAKTEITSDAFLHYVSKRLDLLADEQRWQGDELDLISAYLDCRLLLPNMMGSEASELDGISVGGYSGKIDQLMAFERGEYPDKPDLELQLPNNVIDIFSQLKTWDDDAARWTSFALLELGDESLHRIRGCMRELKSTFIPHDGFRRMSFLEGDVCISLVGSSKATFDELNENMQMRGMTEKYKHKVTRSIVFGVLSNGDNKVFDSAKYIEFDWFESSELQEMVNNEPDVMPSVVPKVNEPCFCGSGKKYKKCCRNKVDKARRKYPQLTG
jgi:hypothetical protein